MCRRPCRCTSWGLAGRRSSAEPPRPAGAPPDYVALALLTAAGALLANGRRIEAWDGWVEPPLLFGAVIGRPSTNKSPAIGVVRDLMARIEAEQNADHAERRRRHRTDTETAAAHMEAWRRDVQDAVKHHLPPPCQPAEAEPPPAPRRRRLLVNDATTEQLCRLLADNAHGLLQFRDELSGWFGGMNRYSTGQSDRAFWLEAYGGRRFMIDRVRDDEPVAIPALSLGVLGGMQPDRLAEILAGADDGLTARMLFVWPEPIPPKRPEVPLDARAAFRALRQLAGLERPEGANGPGWKRVGLSEPAVQALGDFRERRAADERQAGGQLLSWLGKQNGTLLRLALILAYLRWAMDEPATPEPLEIGKALLEDAAELIEAYFIPMARRAFGEASLPEIERDAHALARWIRGRLPGLQTINARDLRRARAIPTDQAPRYDAAIGELVEAGWLRQPPSSGSGRPRKDYLINPKLIAPG